MPLEARGARASMQGDSAEVRAALERVLASPGFASAARRSRLLRYLVEHALAGSGGDVTEYGIGLDVFERPPSFDPRVDSIVRTETSRLRQKLREYYAARNGGEPIHIEIPPRSYVPLIGVCHAPAAPVSTARVNRQRRTGALVAALVIAGGIAAAALVRSRLAGAPLTSVVVLPFADYSPRADAEYLADGVTEELTNELAQRRDLRVVSRTSAFAFKGRGVDVREIGKRLAAGAALEGSISKAGDTVRVTAQLNRTSDGYHLWSSSFETPYRDLALTEARISQAVEAAVLRRAAPEKAAAPSTADSEAHDLYLRASYEMSRQTPDSFLRALELYQAAVKRDPTYVNAYRGMARAETARIHITAEAPRPAFERARAALEKALEIQPGDAESLGQLADIDYVYEWDWPRAEREFRTAVERGAQSTTRSYYGWALATRGRFDEAHRQLRIAQDLDPLGAGPRTNQALAFMLERRYEQMRRVLQESIDANSSVLAAHLLMGLAYLYERDCARADENFNWVARRFPSPLANIGLAFNASCRGDAQSAKGYIAKASETGGAAFVSPYQLAMAYAFVNDREAALANLEKSAEAREGQIFYIKYDAAFAGIRGDPRFTALEKKIGLE